jgi:hypothetical protein
MIEGGASPDQLALRARQTLTESYAKAHGLKELAKIFKTSQLGVKVRRWQLRRRALNCKAAAELAPARADGAQAPQHHRGEGPQAGRQVLGGDLSARRPGGRLRAPPAKRARFEISNFPRFHTARTSAKCPQARIGTLQQQAPTARSKRATGARAAAAAAAKPSFSLLPAQSCGLAAYMCTRAPSPPQATGRPAAPSPARERHKSAPSSLPLPGATVCSGTAARMSHTFSAPS